MTQNEVVRAIGNEAERGISQPYLSQLERGQRRHLTNTTRLLLAKFFKVHPGYLVDDPDDSHPNLPPTSSDREEQLDLWLMAGAERFRKDPVLAEALLKVAQYGDTRGCLLVLAASLKTPELLDRLRDAVTQEA